MQQEMPQFHGTYEFASQDFVSPPVAVLEQLPETPRPLEQEPAQTSSEIQGAVTSPSPLRKQFGRTRAIVLLALVLALIFGTGLFAGWEFSQGGTHTITPTSSIGPASGVAALTGAVTPETLQEAAIAKIEPAVVELNVTTAQGQQIGSGVIIDAKGDIITNQHVVNGGQTIEVVLSTGRTEQALLVGSDVADDLAVVRIQPFAQMVVAQIGDSSQLTVGQEVLAVGNPLGITETATKGIVSALNRSVSESTGTTISHAIQTDAAVNPGNSGGALVNMQGELIGIPTMTAINTEFNTAASGVSFAIPSNLVKTVLQHMLQQ